MFILKLIISISPFLRCGKQSVSCTFISSNRTKLLLVYFYSFIHILNTINMWSCEIIYRMQLRGKISCLYYLVYLQVGRNWKNNTDDYELSVKKIWNEVLTRTDWRVTYPLSSNHAHSGEVTGSQLVSAYTRVICNFIASCIICYDISVVKFFKSAVCIFVLKKIQN